jgi:DNA-3-methyladenine glycosylase II
MKLHPAPRAPFHLEATVRVLQRRPDNRVEKWQDGRYRRLFATDAGLVLVEANNAGTIAAPEIRWRVLAGQPDEATVTRLDRALGRVLGLDIDPAPLERQARAEAPLKANARALAGMRPPRFADWYEAFGNVIPFQQVSLEAGIAIVGRFIERFGESLALDEQRYFTFPAPARVAEAKVETLRECGLSRTKANALVAIASAIASGELSRERIASLSTADALAKLRELRGIGPWSAGLALLRGLGRLDVFPPGDAGAQKGLARLLRLDETGESLGEVAERFGRYRGYLYFQSLGANLLGKGLIHPAREEDQQ